MTRPVRARVNRGALHHNLQQARRHSPGARVMAVVKADAYGHGLERAAAALDEADAFGLISVDEAVRLRAAGCDKPLCLLEGFFAADELEELARHRVAASVHHDAQLQMIESAGGSRHGPLEVWIKIDTGMHRIGFAPQRLAEVAERLGRLDGVRVRGVMSHFACADEPQHPANAAQLACFRDHTDGGGMVRSLANSAALLGLPDSHFDWVRPGIMLYGASPLAGRSAAELGLRPVMQLESRLIAVNRVAAGDAVGYGASWVCPETMPVGVVACGYGDGYPRHAPAGTPVLVDGVEVPLIGRVSMDMITLDLRPAPRAEVGSPVVLWGEGLAVDTVAQQAGTIAYELLCGVTARVPRVTD